MAEFDSEERIGRLLQTLLDTYEPCYGLGSMTVSVYDTAWVACISKTVSGCSQWLFPSSFLYVLQAQLPDGGWTAHAGQECSDETDGILSTMAATYCLIQHAKTPLQLKHIPAEALAESIRTALASLDLMLQSWRVGNSKAVGFEVLAPSLLNLLEEEGHFFAFPGKEHLLHVRDQKLARVSPELLYKSSPSALLHSLEAFHYRKDISYDRFAHQKVGGSMMASPSATASYLIRCKTWDDEAEAYLRLVLSNGHGCGLGGVPSAYPSTNFELTWVVSTLLEAGLWTPDLDERYAAKILTMLEDSRRLGGGLVGFAPGIEPDLDDSAKSSIIFSLLGRRGFSSQIVENFDSAQCLKTYKGERNPSLTANCNALLSVLLDLDDSRPYQSRYLPIQKITRFICDSWWNTSGPLNDKWNLSPFYPAMLMVQSLMELLHKWHDGNLPELESALLRERVIPTLFQCLGQLLQSQNPDGSWGNRGPREETSYAIVALTNLVSLAPNQYLETEIMSAIHCGRSFLKQSAVGIAEYLWIEKVTYASENLAEAYVIAALQGSAHKVSLRYAILHLCGIDLEELEHVAALAESGLIPDDDTSLVISWIMSWLYVPILQRMLGKPASGSYQDTAFRWMVPNSRVVSPLSPKDLLDIITASILVDDLANLVDECMAPGNHKLNIILADAFHAATIHANEHAQATTNGETHGVQAFEPPKANGKSTLLTNGVSVEEACHGQCNGMVTPSNHSTVERTLFTFLDFFDTSDATRKGSEADRRSLQSEVKRYISAQLCRVSLFEEQVHRNQVVCDGMVPQEGAEPPLHDITRERSGTLTGLPLLFAFTICLTSPKGRESFRNVWQKYMADEVSNSIATVFHLEQAADQMRLCLPTSRLELMAAEHSSALIPYEKQRLRLALKHLERTVEDKEVLGAVELVTGMAEFTARLFTVDW
ncbi:MAG: hypothetical protein Q9177_006175 [Variospora cf. flavescens]